MLCPVVFLGWPLHYLGNRGREQSCSAREIWDGSDFFPELLACVKRLTLQRDVFQASPHELSATVFDSL